MSTPNDGGPAFPLSDIEWNGARKHNNGMTLRDYFAAAVLQGELARCAHVGTLSDMARYSYEAADAMLAERAKTTEVQS